MPDTESGRLVVRGKRGMERAAGVNYQPRTMDQTLGLQTTPGYDDVTGVGTPAAGFLAALQWQHGPLPGR